MIPEIVFPTGIGGNHARWLLSIDPKFNLPYGHSAVDKTTWICLNVYTHRTWNNWLTKEWEYRNQLNALMRVEHHATQPNESMDDARWQNKKQLFLTVNNPTMSAYHYFMVNIGLNNQTNLKSLLGQISEWNYTVAKINDKNLSTKQSLASDCISEPTLNADWYQSLVEWAGFDNLYDQASQIHTAYYQCRQKAAKDFINYFEGPEFQLHLNFYKHTYINQTL